MKPSNEEIPEFYRGYVNTLSQKELYELLKETLDRITQLLESFPESAKDLKYGEGKWSVAEVIQHIIDSERVFTYRALRFSRNDSTDLPGFDQNDYVVQSEADSRDLDTLISELKTLRKSTIDFYQSLQVKQRSRTGTANGMPVSVEVIGYITAGHMNHHANILEERYLPVLNDQS